MPERLMPCRSAEQVRSRAAMEDRGKEKQILASSSGGTFVSLIFMLWKLENCKQIDHDSVGTLERINAVREVC